MIVGVWNWNAGTSAFDPLNVNPSVAVAEVGTDVDPIKFLGDIHGYAQARIDQDGVPNSEDECPEEKETINGIQDEDGCADGGPAKVIRESGEIKILENVQFESGSANIKPESYSVLNQVALVMKANPHIKVLRVEGHTDERGDHALNMQLSKARADSVRTYLIGRGVSSARLKAEGYGPDKPLVSGDGPEALAKNRRVEFKIEE